MGMTIDEARTALGKERKYALHENKQAFDIAIDTMRKYQQLRADYENHLKADLVAMLTEIQLEIEEHEESIIGHYGKETKESDFPSHKIERNNGRKECVNLIQQKIAKLKG